MKKYFYLAFFFMVAFGYSQEKEANDTKDFYLKKGKGFEFHFDQDKYMFYIDFRGQFRASYPHQNFPTNEDDFSDDDINMGISRARIKFGGYVGKPEYNFYLEQDIRGGNLLDFRAQIEKLPYLKFRVGQWKARYSRERVISSGKQTGLERSLINRIFTIDRQQGFSLYGNLDGGGAANFNYWAEILTGSGRGGAVGDDENLMYMMRLQWNPNGKELGFSGSDLKFHEKFVGSVAIAGVTNTSKYTRFSTSGGGQLYGYEPGVDGQYKVDQFLFETAFKYRGLSFDQELHFKNIDDRVNLEETLLIGNYFQVGYFFHYLFDKFPKPLEVFARQAFFDPDTDISNDLNYEYTFGLNWFFKGHKNKLTVDYSYLKFNQFDIEDNIDHMVRIQWDVSIF
ncbi:porin [Lutimonas zeaxanthinifaciens]|uniref:porin n=1 Tax=Lutimonas zeaxanthinifaciens TaxID=3060215 RepID=UPI00265C8E85|nr:porin [Lutimonas sp. YSD2104]WKK66097.1 porin [Lutimonas sp. YSD2104]